MGLPNPLPTAANPNGAGSSSSKPWEGAATATAEKAGWPTADERGDRADGACTSSYALSSSPPRCIFAPFLFLGELPIWFQARLEDAAGLESLCLVVVS